MRKLKLSLFLLVLGAYPAHAGMLGMNISASTLALTSSTMQGGQGPSGSTILTQGDAVYNWSWYGIGMFYTLDIQGSAEKDHGVGPKIEFHYGPFYMEGGFAISFKREFTDRSIAEQSGNGWFAGVGVRFGLESPDTGWFFQASYKFRFMTIRKQDSTTLTEAITIKDGFPLVGVGINF